MKRFRIRISSLLVLPFLAACAGRAPVVGELPSPPLATVVDAIADAPPFDRTLWGILVEDVRTGEVLYERNGPRKFIPASNTKLVVTAVAMGMFGPDHRYRSPFLAVGRNGDTASSLVLVGTGDPTWSARFHGDVATPLDSMAALVAAAGLTAVDTLVVDISLFQDALVHPAWEVSDLPGQFAPPVDAVSAGESVFQLHISGAAVAGYPATGEVVGPLPQPIRVDVRTDTAGAPTSISLDYTARRDTIYVTGSIAVGGRSTTTRALTRPAESTGAALADALRAHGVSVGGVVTIRDPEAAAAARAGGEPVAEWVSPPMHEIVAAILQPSQNWIAEQLLKTLGAEFGPAGTWNGGVSVERAYLYEAAGIDSLAVNLRDASGMAPQNLLSPEATVGIYRHAWAQPWGPLFRDALAAPGRTGTLSGRLPSLEGRVFGKTGTISNVNTLSGYLDARDGREYVFVVYTNGTGLPAGVVREAIDEIVLAIADRIDDP